MSLSLRPVLPNDEQFLYNLAYQTLYEQLCAWAWTPAMREKLLGLQIRAKQSAYAAMHPRADDAIILVDDEPVGRMIIDRAGEHYQLVDISILAKHRGSGIGTRLILALCTEAELMRKNVRLSVSLTNPRAAALYKRLGFRVIEDLPMDQTMERAPGDRAQVIAQP